MQCIVALCIGVRFRTVRLPFPTGSKRMSQSRSTPTEPVRGVFVADPNQPPVPPPGARAVEMRGSQGEFIAWVMVPGEQADEFFYTRMWTYLSHRDPLPASEVSPVSLRLLPP